ncbi:MAG: hydroxypyruvate isomerase family protein [Burkholderiales bacterium]|nr:hydroxypyruvate isomerase family protein [Burkholderiales bacterium]
MPRLCANISLLFNEVDLPERFDAAARAGFRAVEIQFPYAFDAAMLAERARRAGVEVVLCNLPGGDFERGDRGIACLPARVSEFRDGVALALRYARALGCRRLNCLAGVAPPRSRGETLRDTLISNLRFAAGELAHEGVELLLEPANTRTVPGFFLRNTVQAADIIDEARAPNLSLQYDLFHMQIMDGDLARTIETFLPRIGHMQVADVPDRHEPGTGEINFPFLFDWIDRLGYSKWIGAEYVPAAGTEAGLGWARAYLEPAAAGGA